MTPLELKTYSNGYQRRINREAWLHGVYALDAITAVASSLFAGKRKSKIYDYPKSPRRDLQPMTEEEKQAEIEAERLKAYAYFDSIVQACKQQKEPEKVLDDLEALRARVYMQQMVQAGQSWGA